MTTYELRVALWVHIGINWLISMVFIFTETRASRFMAFWFFVANSIVAVVIAWILKDRYIQ